MLLLLLVVEYADYCKKVNKYFPGKKVVPHADGD